MAATPSAGEGASRLRPWCIEHEMEVPEFWQDPDKVDAEEDPSAQDARRSKLLPRLGAVGKIDSTRLPSRLGDVFEFGPHRLATLMWGDPAARLVLTDEPYNVPIAGHVTGGQHREFAMASGEMTDAEFLAFNKAWMGAVLPCLCDGGVFGTFIDWRGLPTVSAAAAELGLKPLNLIVWAKTNAGMGSLYRSQHELLPLFKSGSAPPTSIMSSSANAAAGARTSGLIPAPHRWVQTPVAASRTTRPSSRPPCLRTHSSTSPIAAILSSTRSSAPVRPSSPPRRRAASAAASSSIRCMST